MRGIKRSKNNTRVPAHDTREYSDDLKRPVKRFEFCWDVEFWLLPFQNLIKIG